MAGKDRAPDFGAWLKITRQQRGLTLQQLADKMGVAKQTVGNWEKAHDTLSDKAIRKLAKALRLDYFQVKRAWLSDVDRGALIDLGYGSTLGTAGLDALVKIMDAFNSLPDDKSRTQAANKFHTLVQRILKS